MSRLEPAPTRRIRIGDAERDEAVSALGEHYVAGRLTLEEFDERSDRATRARYAEDLAPLFADLPDQRRPAGEPPASRAQTRGRRGPQLLIPLTTVLMLAMIVAAVVLTTPWILWVAFGVLLFGGRCDRGGHRPHNGRRPQ